MKSAVYILNAAISHQIDGRFKMVKLTTRAQGSRIDFEQAEKDETSYVSNF